MNTVPLSFASKPLLASLLGLATLGLATSAHAAQERARVISSTPVLEQVAVPREVCRDETVTVQGRKSGAGALVGGIAGGAIGNALGNGSGRAVATALGLFGGAILGDRIEGGGQPQSQTVRQCHTRTVYENQTMAYDVVYEYAGKRYSVQMDRDPGPYVQLDIAPVGRIEPEPAPVHYPSPSSYYDDSPVVGQIEVGTSYYPGYAVTPGVVYIGGRGHSHGNRHGQERRGRRDDGPNRYPGLRSERWDR